VKLVAVVPVYCICSESMVSSPEYGKPNVETTLATVSVTSIELESCAVIAP
jgi:hypothetical protein